MKLSTTLILLLLAAGLFTFVFVHERELPGTKERLASETRALSFIVKEITEIDITAKEKPVKLRKKSGEWWITGPIDDRADPDAVQKFLEALGKLEWLETQKRKDFKKEDFRKTGLGSAATEIILRNDKDRVAYCRLGSAGAIDKTVYANTKEDAEEVHLVDAAVVPMAQRTADEWRDARLVRAKLEDIQRFTLSAGNGVMEFVRDAGQPWRIIRPLRTAASSDRVNGVIAMLLNLNVKAEKNAAPVAAASGVPQMNIVMTSASLSKPIEITLHPSPNAETPVQAEATGRPGIFSAPEKAQDLWKLQPNHLRDQNLARIPADRLTNFRMRSLKFGEVLLERQNDMWMLKRFGKTEPANAERVKQLMEMMNIEQVREFVSDSATNLEPYGLQAPFLEMEWSTPEKTSLLLFGIDPQSRIFAKYADEPFIYRVNPMLLTTIPYDISKWRGLRVLNASLFSVRRITIARGTAPTVTLRYNPDEATWKGDMGGQDITANLDGALANQFLHRIVNFEAADWSADRTSAYEALKKPVLTIEVLTATPGKPITEAKADTLTFAPIVPGMDSAVYHGRLNQDLDTFLITRDTFRELTQALFAP